jgi:Holliday junction resolvase
LKKKGCYVIKTHPGLGTPTGVPDIIFFKGNFYGAIECKRSKQAPWQPLQLETLNKFNRWSYGKAVYPENIDDIMEELRIIL